MWSAKYREPLVKNTPWKDDEGDVFCEFFDACRDEGIRTVFILALGQAEAIRHSSLQ